jgi:hypothetical protein
MCIPTLSHMQASEASPCNNVNHVAYVSFVLQLEYCRYVNTLDGHVLTRKVRTF